MLYCVLLKMLLCVIYFVLFFSSCSLYLMTFSIQIFIYENCFYLLLLLLTLYSLCFFLFISPKYITKKNNNNNMYVVICNALYASNTDIVITSLIYSLVQLFSTISFSSFIVYYIIILLIVAVVISCLL